VDRVAENRYQQLPTVILLDDVDGVHRDAMTHLVRLIRQDHSAESTLTVALALDKPALKHLERRLVELSDLRIDLEPWEADDTLRFLSNSLAKAGSDRCVFADSAASRLHELSRGLPRQVSHLAELSLLAGAGRKLPQIDVATVESVYQELHLQV
jgi:general secretion pathway protein A